MSAVGGSGPGGGYNISDQETKTSITFNGRPIYVKYVFLGVEPTRNGFTETPHGIESMDMEGFLKTEMWATYNGYFYQPSYTSANGYTLYSHLIDINNIRLETKDVATDRNFHAVIYYQKTSD